MSPGIERIIQRMEFCFDNHEPEKTEATHWLFLNITLKHQENWRLSHQWDVVGVGKVTVTYEISSRVHVMIHKGTKHEMWMLELNGEDLDSMQVWLTANKLADMGEGK